MDEQGALVKTSKFTKIRIKFKGLTSSLPISKGVSKAHRRRKTLGLFPNPAADAGAIVHALRNAGPAEKLILNWNESSLEIPSQFHSILISLSKDFTNLLSSQPTAPSSKGHECGAEPEVVHSKGIEGRTSHDAMVLGAAPGKESLCKQADDCQETATCNHKVVDITPGASYSDQGTLTGYSLQSSSPEGEPPCCSGRGSLVDHVVQAQHFASKNSLSSSCQVGRGRIMPFSSLRPTHFCAAALSMQSISPAQMCLNYPPSGQRYVDENASTSLIENARNTKHAADLERGGKTAPWTVKALCRQVESAILFMEACECMAQGQMTVEKSVRLSKLYSDTSALLTYSITVTDEAQGPDSAKEALRILSGHLHTTCRLKEAVYSKSKLAEATSRAHHLSAHHRQAQAQPRQHSEVPPQTEHAPRPAAAAGDSTGLKRGQQSHDSRHELSASQAVRHSAGVGSVKTLQFGKGSLGSAPPTVQQQAHAGHPLISPEGMTRLLEQAKQVASFSNKMRRSPQVFQGFLERPDVQGSALAKVVSMHMACVSVDVGMHNGLHVLSHARKACAGIRSMCRDSPHGIIYHP
ncbi:hypothetical protein CEUSTIGMA_g2933.t1 [Chlamydomonas eustigma]|uniref:Uncharacterized protein n=1 Tax=Chlamydomonas eustigma TaxID=1157962 RepID=A0A250WYA0_9CHLO|nr:hypothetical protein CEUSTIGMA_g2933.t1 [Chlamydomonas eustigma]|eukprot:GAX75490.1 hypothetical protein CEUSTIGMA_g2933.t1 [Chlamydomonas eustigma]